ncbi:hypothetical protein [Frondihabitans sucicola]|uniref:hypothetical protein n=1 Tax=Frondihabitans sucicola TaxID=1268041 RepID=UPI0025723F84|nr:hypothetical protein [Frondihabitans sucicola]
MSLRRAVSAVARAERQERDWSTSWTVAERDRARAALIALRKRITPPTDPL